jgi:hypothetical protein
MAGLTFFTEVILMGVLVTVITELELHVSEPGCPERSIFWRLMALDALNLEVSALERIFRIPVMIKIDMFAFPAVHGMTGETFFPEMVLMGVFVAVCT